MTEQNQGFLTRRGFLGVAAGAAGVAAAGGLAGCSSSLKTASSPASSGGGSAAGGTIKIGFVSPQTGQLSIFTQSNGYVLGQVRKALAGGLTIGGKKYSVEIISADSQSSSARAATVASQLVQQQQVDFLLATATPETVIPVSAQAEASGVPCVVTICPWEQWYYTSSGAAKSFTYSYMYFLGTQEETDLFTRVWAKAPTNKVVGGLWPNDVDGAGFEKYMKQKLNSMGGWKIVPSGGYADGTSDFASIISKFKAADVEVLHAVPIPPDFITFWRQAHQNGFTPKIATISKALLFPSAAEALGPLVNNVMSPLWWTPQFPYKSSLDGTTAPALAADYKTATGNDWTQPMGFNYAVFEIAAAALKASGDPKDRKAVASAIGQLKGQAITGAYDFTSGPVPHVSEIPELLAQWRVKSGGSPELVVIDNSDLPAVPVASQMQML